MAWPLYSRQTGAYMSVDLPPSVQSNLKGKQCDFWSVQLPSFLLLLLVASCFAVCVARRWLRTHSSLVGFRAGTLCSRSTRGCECCCSIDFAELECVCRDCEVCTVVDLSSTEAMLMSA